MGLLSEKSTEKLQIHLENDKVIMYGTSSESSGYVLRGAVILKLNQPTCIKSLLLTFEGTLSINWSHSIESGYERKFSHQEILISQTWPFLQKNKNHILNPGQYSYDFEFVLPGKLLESVHVPQYYLVQYQFKAIAERAGFLATNYVCIKDIHISRQNSIDYSDNPVTISNHWDNNLEYDISIPTRVFSHGDTIPITIRALPLSPNMKVRYINCVFKEYMVCRPIHGRYDGKNKKSCRIIKVCRRDPSHFQNQGCMTDIWSDQFQIPIPSLIEDIQCDVNNESVKISHKIKLTLAIENESGKLSELQATVSINIIMSNYTGHLPAYEETWRTLPYDPVLMMNLIRQHNNDLNLPAYHTLYPIEHNLNNIDSNNNNNSSSSDEESFEDLKLTLRSSLPTYESI